MKDLYHDYLAEHSLYPVSLAGAANGDAIIDLQGFEGALIVCYTGAITVDTVFELKHGDDSGLTDAEAVPDSDLLGSEPTFLNATEDDTVKTFGYIGSKRYLRVDATAGTGIAGAMILKGIPRHAPAV